MKIVPVVAACIIRKDQRVLVTKRLSKNAYKRKWEFPGGQIKLGETPQLALLREIQEELNLEILIHDSFYIHLSRFPKDRNIYLIIFYRCTPVDKVIFEGCGNGVITGSSEELWVEPWDTKDATRVHNLNMLPGDELAMQELVK